MVTFVCWLLRCSIESSQALVHCTAPLTAAKYDWLDSDYILIISTVEYTEYQYAAIHFRTAIKSRKKQNKWKLNHGTKTGKKTLQNVYSRVMTRTLKWHVMELWLKAASSCFISVLLSFLSTRNSWLSDVYICLCSPMFWGRLLSSSLIMCDTVVVEEDLHTVSKENGLVLTWPDKLK